jgi:hypothetical protein
MDTLTTTIKREFLDEIVAGRKRVEYREIKPYWTDKLATVRPPFQLRLINGMSAKAPEATVEICRVIKNDADGCYELHISKVLDVQNLAGEPTRPKGELVREYFVESLIDTPDELDSPESSILTTDFRGELVPQEPNDEPAFVVLERMAAERKTETPAAARGPRPPQSRRPANASRAREGRLTSPAVASIDDYDTEDILCVLRRALPTADRYSRDEFIRAVTRELGFDRAGSRIREAIESTLPTAARRHILWYSGDEVWIGNRTITDYSRDELKEYFLAAVGRNWLERPEAIRAATRYLGFSRTGPTIEDTWKSIINRLIRSGDLESDESAIRRTPAR